jgi:hypothetical protein
MGEIRGFHVPPKYPSRLGAASTPEVQHLRQRTIKPLYLTSYLLVQACQHLWLVHCDDAAAVHFVHHTTQSLLLSAVRCWQS